VEVLAVDNDSPDATGRWLEELARLEPRLRVLHTDQALGTGAVLNLALRQARGRIVAITDPSVEVRGDLLPHLERLLSLPGAGVAGPWGLGTRDMRHFFALKGPGEADAMQFYLFAFPRRLLREVGLLRESFRFYRNLDLDFSFQFRARGYRIYADPCLPVVRYRHRAWRK
jgi:GT2 family glycosyltransferase